MTWLRFIRRDLRFHPVLWGLSLLGIAIGVGGWIGMESATQQAMNAFHRSVEGALGTATHVVEPRQAQLNETVYFDLARRLSSPVSPVLETYARIDLPPDSSPSLRQVRVLGVDPFAAGGQSETEPSNLPVARMIAGDTVAIVSADIARHRGETVALNRPDEALTYRVGGTYPDSTVVKTIWLDVGRFQLDFNRPRELSRVMIRLDRESVDRVKSIVGNRGVVLPRAERTRAVRSMVQAFQWNLRALSYLALFVGAFLVYSTMFLYANRHRRMISLLKTVGVSTREITVILFGGLAVMGAVGSLLGVLVGMVLAGPMGGLVQGTVDQLYRSLFASGTGFTASTALLGWGLGMGMSLLGGMGPLLSQLRVPYRAWEQREFPESSGGRSWRYFFGIAVSCWLLALGLIVGFGHILAGFIACFFIALGGSLMGPVIIHFLSARWISSRWLRLAIRNLRYHLSTTGVMVAVLIAAFSMVFSVDVLVDSFRGSVDQWVDRVVRADYYIRSAPGPETREKPPLSPNFLSMVKREMSNRGEMSPLFEETIYTPEGNPVTIRGIDPVVLESRLTFQFRDTAGDPWEQLKSGRLWLSEPGSFRMNKDAGDTIGYPGRNGRGSITIGAVYNEYGTDWAAGYLSIDRFRSIFGPSQPRSVALFAGNRLSSEQVASWAESYGYVWESRGELRTRAMEQFDRTFAVTDLMKVVAVTVAGVGLFILLLSFVEMRTRLFGRLAAVGVHRIELIRMILWEAICVAVSACLLAIPTGLFLSWVLIHVINRRSFGWLIPMELSISPFLTLIILITMTVFISVLGPLYRLWTQPIHQWLREENE